MDEHIDTSSTEPASKPRKRNKKLDDLLTDTSKEGNDSIEQSDYKNKLKVYVLSGQIKDLYGKIITEHELNKMPEQECENVYKICELKIAQRISHSVVDGIITIFGNLCSKTLPIENKDKYIAELKQDYIINSELKNVAGNIAMRTGKFMGLIAFVVITTANINLYRQELDKELDKDAKELGKELSQELDHELDKRT